MQIGEQRCQLLVGEPAGEGWHHAFAGKHHVTDFPIGRGCATGQRGVREHAMQVGWNFLEIEIVLVVAVRAADQVEMFAFGLLLRKPWLRMASGSERPKGRPENDQCPEKGA